MSRRNRGGVWDTVSNATNVASVISSLLLVDQAATSDQQLTRVSELIDNIADRTQSAIFDDLDELFKAIISNPQTAAPMKRIISQLLAK